MSAIGYIRVSTEEQEVQRQREAINKAVKKDGMKLRKIYEDKQSGSGRDRPKLNEMMGYIREGDSLYIESIDRLSRNLYDLFELIKQIREMGCSIFFVKDNIKLYDASHPSFEDKDSSFECAMATAQIAIFGCVAHVWLKMHKERQKEGIRIAKDKGVVFGRKCKYSQALVEEIEQLAKERNKCPFGAAMLYLEEKLPWRNYSYSQRKTAAISISNRIKKSLINTCGEKRK